MVPASRPIACLVVAWLAASCVSTPGASDTILPGRALAGQPLEPCLVEGTVPVEAKVEGLCGTLEVPEDRSNPGGRKVALRIAVIPALAENPAPDPLFAIAGGPGEASTLFFAWLPGHYADVHATRDIVLVDQRGTGGSNPQGLAPVPDTTGLSGSEADAVLAEWATDGLVVLDIDPRFYTSTVAADDLDDVRAALGYDVIDLYGTSYGGTLAQYYLRQHPDRVRVAVLDGATPLDVPVLERLAANSQAALDLLIARCGKDPACNAAFPDLAAEWASLAEGLAGGITTNVVDPATGQPVVADLLQIGPSLHQALLTEGAASQVPLAIHLAAEGRWDETVVLVPPAPSGGSPLVMALEVVCSEAWARFDPGETSAAGAGSYALPAELAKAEARAAQCAQLPAGVVPAEDAAPVVTDLPILWLTGDGDPQDPPANLAAVPSQQPNALVVAMPAQEHVVGHLGCGPRVIAAFLAAGTAEGLDTACIADGASRRPSFRLP